MADLGAGNVRKRFSLVTYRSYQHGEVMHAAGQHRSDQDPQESRSEAELRGQSWSDQRPSACDRGKVMAEQHPLRRGHVVVAVFVGVSWSCAAIVENQDLGCDKGAVVTVGEREDT